MFLIFSSDSYFIFHLNNKTILWEFVIAPNLINTLFILTKIIFQYLKVIYICENI